MHNQRHGRFGLRQWFCISECIGPNSFSAWNLLWHHQIYCFRDLRRGRNVYWAMHRMQIGPLMQMVKWGSLTFYSRYKGLLACLKANQPQYQTWQLALLTQISSLFTWDNLCPDLHFSHSWRTKKNEDLIHMLLNVCVCPRTALRWLPTVLV